MPDFYREALEQMNVLTGYRRDFHRHPELSRKEFRTAARIEEELDALGIPHSRVDETGVYAELRGEKGDGPVVVLRADIDALPIQEETGMEYASQNDGVMHACGHDMHTASLLYAARELARRKEEFGGTVRFFFQQAEEIGYGARQFIAAGHLKGADRVFGLHTAPDLPLGQVGVKLGSNNASVDYFKIKVHGRAAHVSTPNLGADALFIAAQTVVAIQAIVPRRTSPIDSVLIGIGKLTAGTAYNIVAEEAELEGTTRLFTPELRRYVNEQVEKVAKATAAMYGGEAEVEWVDFAAPVINPADICREVSAEVTAMLGEDALRTDRALSCGGDNFADFQQYVPGVYAYVGVQSEDTPGSCGPLHNSHYNIDERALPIGGALYVRMAWRWLVTDPPKA